MLDNHVFDDHMLDEYFYYTAHQEEIINGHLDEFVSIMGNKHNDKAREWIP
jgi:hypothetical protein